MRKKDESTFTILDSKLTAFHKGDTPILGIVPMENRIAFLKQLIDSIRRVRYVEVIRDLDHSPSRASPNTQLFDPLKAAVMAQRAGDLEEAFWLVFLATHFGKNLRTGWRLSSEVYGSLGTGKTWTWARVNQDVSNFSSWVDGNHQLLTGHFGNHRKYESVKPGGNGTSAVVESYVAWVGKTGSHQKMIANALDLAKGDSRKAFAQLYGSMGSVRRFGRTGRFDYLTMLAKLKLAPIEANSTYMAGATGPIKGARLLFGGSIHSNLTVATLELILGRLEAKLGVGMQVLEDAMCNWQKRPGQYVPFRG